MEIKFRQINEGFIQIIGKNEKGEERCIGKISTPSGSAEDVKNAIQVCGFDEAFDLWGCAIFQKLRNKKERVVSCLEGKENDWKNSKDIQLLFSFETKGDKENIDKKDCWSCFSSPCICENKVSERTNPFNVKRERDLKDKLEYMDKRK